MNYRIIETLGIRNKRNIDFFEGIPLEEMKSGNAILLFEEKDPILLNRLWQKWYYRMGKCGLRVDFYLCKVDLCVYIVKK